MMTVRTFFGSEEIGTIGATAGGALGVIGAGAGGAAPCKETTPESPLDAGAVGQTGAAEAGGAGAAEASTGGADWGGCPETIGMVETTRELILGGSMVTGCSSRGTIFSAAPVPAAPVEAELFAWESPELGMILFGPLLALMIGGRPGNE